MLADANTDQIVDMNDYNIWLDDFVEANPEIIPPPVPTIPGDYDLDGDVDGNDFLIWQRNFGSSGPALPADGNADGSVDAADYTVWRDNYGTSLN